MTQASQKFSSQRKSGFRTATAQPDRRSTALGHRTMDPMDLCPPWAPALGYAGAMVALVMACVGSAWGTGRAALGISAIGVKNPEVRRLRSATHAR